jgi:hypothetical protein
MQAREYIRSVYKDLMGQQSKRRGDPQGAFLAAAIEIVRELDSPLKEETLVRLAMLELESERVERSSFKAAG